MPTTTSASSRPIGRRRSRWRRPSALVAALALLVGIAAACEPVPPDVDPPTFGLSGRTEVSALGPHVRVTWPTATGSPTRYRLDANGVQVTMSSSTATTCVVVGLTAATTYTFRISAYDAAGNWSGSEPGLVEPTGFRYASYTTPSGLGGGPTLRCIAPTDTDGDRLPNALETGTGIFVNTASTGTVAADPDSDEDGLRDGDEVLGAANGLDLPAFGVRPTGKDILVELDWATSPACSIDMRPRSAWVDPIVSAFAGTPVQSLGPDYVKLIVDYGQGGLMTGGNAVPSPDGRLQGTGTTNPMADNLSAQRQGYFHYGAIGSTLEQAGQVFMGGLGQLGGAVMAFGFGCQAGDLPDHARSGVFMHELGHNMGLQHGGHETLNNKPNYNSVMNYRFMTTGADQNCDGVGDTPRAFRYSYEVRGSIDENAINETVGACGVPMHIDNDFVIDPGIYAADVNYDGLRTVLQGSNDLEHLYVGVFADENRSGRDDFIYDPLP